MEKELIQKVEIKDIPKYSLFIYRKEKWRSIGKIVEGSHSITAQKVFVNEYGSEVCVSNADFSEHLRVKPYVGDLDWLPKGKQGSISEYQRYLDIDRVHL